MYVVRSYYCVRMMTCILPAKASRRLVAEGCAIDACRDGLLHNSTVLPSTYGHASRLHSTYGSAQCDLPRHRVTDRKPSPSKRFCARSPAAFYVYVVRACCCAPMRLLSRCVVLCSSIIRPSLATDGNNEPMLVRRRKHWQVGRVPLPRDKRWSPLSRSSRHIVHNLVLRTCPCHP
jgi:hypothetical protein